MLKLSWVKLVGGKAWCPFETVNLSSVKTKGVYIIWYAGSNGKSGRVVYVGQGDIAARLLAHRNNKAITGYRTFGKLYVTWASVPSHQMDGVEKYLADKWDPEVGDAYPNVLPIAVNSPWG